MVDATNELRERMTGEQERSPGGSTAIALGLRLLGWAICANTLLFAVLLGNHG